MLGYWATGRPRNATIPAIVMMIEMTIATIGRLTKNFAIAPPGFLACRRFSFLLRRVGTSRICRRLLVRLGCHDHSRAYLLDPLNNDLLAFLQSFRDNYLALKAWPNFDRPDFRFVTLPKDSDLIASLQLD